MRRLLAILLLAAFGLPAVAPLLAFGQDVQNSLPACCRRTGIHHCAMDAAQRGDAPAISSSCPLFQQPSAAVPHAPVTAFPTTSTFVQLLLVLPSAPQRAETQRLLSSERPCQTRGPPATASF